MSARLDTAIVLVVFQASSKMCNCGVNSIPHQLEIVSGRCPQARMETALEAVTILPDSGLRVAPCVVKEEEQAACLPLNALGSGDQVECAGPILKCSAHHKARPGQRSAALHRVSQALATWELLEAKSRIVLELVPREVKAIWYRRGSVSAPWLHFHLSLPR